MTDSAPLPEHEMYPDDMSNVNPRVVLKKWRALRDDLFATERVVWADAAVELWDALSASVEAHAETWRRLAQMYTEDLQAEVGAHEETKRALRQYGTHRIGCETWGARECDCGLVKALTALEET